MNKTNGIIIALLIILIGLAAFIAFKPTKPATIPVEEIIPISQSASVSSTSTGTPVTKKPKPLPTTLPNGISGQGNWPPSIQHSATSYSCNAPTGNGEVAPKVEQKTINDRVYCIELISDGAAGSVFYKYNYSTATIGGPGTETSNFTLRYQTCGVYGGPGDAQYDQCKNNQSHFNLDAIVDSMIAR